MIETIVTDDGSLTARHKILGDLYHSNRGAMSEAQYVYIENGLDKFLSNDSHDEMTVFDMGLGTALNAWLTLLRSRTLAKSVKYYAIEKYPLSFEEQLSFHYSTGRLYENLLSAPWNREISLTENFSVCKIEGDIMNFDFSSIKPLDVVYWDAFSPDSQPSLWSLDLFARLYDNMSKGGVLSTYSAKGTVKQALRGAGFMVYRLKGALGKRHMLRATK